MESNKIRIGNLVLSKGTLLKIIAVLILIPLLDSVILQFFATSSILLIIPVNLILLLFLLRNIKDEIREVKPK